MREALALLTPFGGARPLSARAVPWFPWVGAIIGVLLGAAWWATDQLWPPAVAAALVIAVDLGLTGMLHLDGLVDTADGLLPHLRRERRLTVMAEPDVGAFGIGVAVTTLGLRWAAIASLAARPATIVALWVLARLVMTLGVVLVPSARPDGMAALVSARAALSTPLLREPVLWSSVLAFAVAAGLLAGGPGSVVPLVGAVAGAGVVGLARRRLGGVTGDVLGAAGLLTETLGLVLAAAKW